jgi:hypothetical protein
MLEIIKDEKKEVSTNEQKTLNQRIEDLVNSLEKNQTVNKRIHSLKFSFIRGITHGLGFVIGSTILAGFLYYFFITFLGLDFMKE